jgi:hypothetical protein
MAFRRRSLEEEVAEAALKGTLRKSLSRLDLICLVRGCVALAWFCKRRS